MTQTFELAIENLPKKLEDLQIWVENDPQGSFNLILNTATHLEQLYQDINLARCTILGLASKHWDNFPVTDTEKWDHSFIKFAKHITGGYTRKTIDNMARVGRIWLLGELPNSIPDEVVLYDREGEVVVDQDTGEVVTIQPNPYNQSVSKLLVATAAAKNGRLEEDEIALGQLFNPDVGVSLIRGSLSKTKDLAKRYELEFILEGPYLIAKLGPEEVLIAELNGGDNPSEFSLINQARGKLKAALKVEVR